MIRNTLPATAGKTQFNIDLPADAPREGKRGRGGGGRRAKREAKLDPDVRAGKDAHFFVSLYKYDPGEANDAGFELALSAKGSRGQAAPVHATGGATLTRLAERDFKMHETGM
ncbi:MAG: hypothetical protein QF437_20775 [Planctomycetota bacterium]|jgi:hypothetical protein|nr:hypothetical protein [Planctomycetota bacterium]MDP7132942.1 hypothetical protein [Planctomycetota bacterium]